MNCYGIGICASDAEAPVRKSILSDIPANLPETSLLMKKKRKKMYRCLHAMKPNSAVPRKLGLEDKHI